MSALISKRIVLAIPIFFLLAPVASAALININTADSSELQTLSGIGPTKAQAIIDYRNANGDFQKIEDIKNVSGIGDATYNNIKDFITVGTVEPPLESSQADTIYEPESVSTITPSSLTIDIGRDRVGTAGSPMEFEVDIDEGYGRYNTFSWNFGDGMQAGGPAVSHTYDYPGEYTVVLRASLFGKEVVDRVSVKIIDGGLSIVSANTKRIDIKNSSLDEASLFGRALVSHDKTFVFPKDTVIRAGQIIPFSSKATGLNPGSINEVMLITVGDSLGGAPLRERVYEEKMARVDEIRGQIASLQQRKLALMRDQNSLDTSQNLAIEGVQNAGGVEEGEFTQTASAMDSLPKDGSESWFSKLKRFFLRTR